MHGTTTSQGNRSGACTMNDNTGDEPSQVRLRIHVFNTEFGDKSWVESGRFDGVHDLR